MAKGNTSKGKKPAANRPADEAVEAAGQTVPRTLWVRKDGAICFGDECLILKPSDDGKDLDVEIRPDRCGAVYAEALRDTIFDTIGKGGSATFKIKGELKEEK